MFLADPNKIAMEDTAAYVTKCKSLIYCSFVEDSQHSAIATSIKADINAVENEGDRVEHDVAKYRSRHKGKVKEAVRKKRVDTIISANKIVANAANLKKYVERRTTYPPDVQLSSRRRTQTLPPPVRATADGRSAFVSVMHGCNNVFSCCVGPSLVGGSDRGTSTQSWNSAAASPARA